MATELLASILLLILSLFITLYTGTIRRLWSHPSPSTSSSFKFPKSYPIIGAYFAIYCNRERRVQWLSDMILNSPTSTFVLHRFFGQYQVFTGNPDNVKHILKTHFHLYPKGDLLRDSLHDLLGDGIFNVNGDQWKVQRQVSSHEFNRKSLRKFVETVVEAELRDRLVPMLASAAANRTVLDLQDVLKRFTFDNICNIAFGYDPAYLVPSLPRAEFAEAFEEAVLISSGRLNAILPIMWKLKSFFRIGSERRLGELISQVRGFAGDLIREKNAQLQQAGDDSREEIDILSRYLMSGRFDEDYVIDIIISFIHAGRDTTSAALTWYFWLIAQNPRVEEKILEEVMEASEEMAYEDVKDMVYTHASLCESMRLYPPVPVDTKEAAVDDVLPDGTRVKKGTRVVYHPYAMGRLAKLWGADWPDFKPERWLEMDESTGKWGFAGMDPYAYPVFQAGPRICLGKEMAFLQMKRVVASVTRRFRIVPAFGRKPVYFADLTSKMKGGFPVRIEERMGS
ncbi:hypothetical protein MLD38_028062 [Melastoma candidum]|uniref:Uncharacterized protein n=1 Tax=Melastoma candidum TaxID=119954 RepID=A0ACB9N013_9MYRT|nr:hypothetical protein MLD38_028062 [Melastoma candidum]